MIAGPLYGRTITVGMFDALVRVMISKCGAIRSMLSAFACKGRYTLTLIRSHILRRGRASMLELLQQDQNHNHRKQAPDDKENDTTAMMKISLQKPRVHIDGEG